jgi:hypothetical protein
MALALSTCRLLLGFRDLSRRPLIHQLICGFRWRDLRLADAVGVAVVRETDSEDCAEAQDRDERPAN